MRKCKLQQCGAESDAVGRGPVSLRSNPLSEEEEEEDDHFEATRFNKQAVTDCPRDLRLAPRRASRNLSFEREGGAARLLIIHSLRAQTTDNGQKRDTGPFLSSPPRKSQILETTHWLDSLI